MSAVFKKLNWKDQAEILILNAPASFEPELAALTGVTIRRSLAEMAQVTFSIAFVTRQSEANALAEEIAAKTIGDAVVWFAYPKSSSKRYQCEFNRDTGWAVLGALGFEAVRQVAIDEDWSALRFRRAKFIKSMTRDSKMAMSDLGKQKLADAEAKGNE
jgi:hypothetical protein